MRCGDLLLLILLLGVGGVGGGVGVVAIVLVCLFAVLLLDRACSWLHKLLTFHVSSFAQFQSNSFSSSYGSAKLQRSLIGVRLNLTTGALTDGAPTGTPLM